MSTYKNKLSFIIALSLYIGAAIGQGAETLTLRQCFDLAKNQSEKLKIQSESITQAQANKKAALGRILPDISWKQSTTWQDTRGVDSSTSSNSDNNSFDRRRTESRFTLRQPIFSGFKEFSAMSGFSAEMRGQTYNLQRSNVLLYRDVAEAFLNVVAYETDIFNIRTTIKLNQDRIAELKERVRVGRSRESEMASAESQLANLKSNEAKTLGDMTVARESLSYLIGRDLADVSLVDNIETPAIGSLEEALKDAENRSDLQALREFAEARRFAIRVARGDYYPGIDVTGNYYTRRLGFLKNVDWDVALNIDVPLFQGGKVSAATKEAQSEWRAAKLQWDLGRRQVQTEIKQTHAALKSSLITAELLDDAYKKAKRSYDLQAKEYRYGLVTNLDVLQALTTMMVVKQNWDRAIIRSKLDGIDLVAATEKLFGNNLGEESNP